MFTWNSETIMWNSGLDESQAGIKIAERNINNLRYADDTPLMAESDKELKSLLMKVKEENEKAGLKLSIQKMKITATGIITLWQIEGKKWKQWKVLCSWAPKLLWMVTVAMKLINESGQTLGDSTGQRRLASCSPWGHKELDRTEQLNNNISNSIQLGILYFLFAKPGNFIFSEHEKEYLYLTNLRQALLLYWFYYEKTLVKLPQHVWSA